MIIGNLLVSFVIHLINIIAEECRAVKEKKAPPEKTGKINLYSLSRE